MDYKKLGMRVRQQRVLCQLTQEQLAEKAGVSNSFIGHIERGEKKASVETVVALCNAMKISPNYLLQDSLDQQVLNDSVDVGQKNKALFDDLMNVLREHHIREEKY